MNLDQFRAMLTLCDGIEGRTVLPVPDPSAERIFGGQTMAQLIVAAAPPGSAKAVKSLQIAFPRAGRAAGPLHLDLEQTHDGRSLGHRRAVAWASQRDADVSVQTGVVTHSVWFHQPLTSRGGCGQIHGVRLAGGRGFGTGDVYTESGTHVASFAQESVVRTPPTGMQP